MAFLRKHPILSFTLLAYGISWPGFWLEARGYSLGYFPGYFGPAIAGLIMTAVLNGKTGLEDLFRRLFTWRVPLRWWLASLLLPVVSVLLVFPVMGLLGYGWGLDLLGNLIRQPDLGLFLFISTLYGMFVLIGEEIGWRGFALPHLLHQHTAIKASILVGIIWGLWHLPLGFLYYAGSINWIDALFYGLGIDMAAVIYTWLYQHTRGSLLILLLFHSMYDVAVLTIGQIPNVVLGSSLGFRTHMLMLTGIALVLVLRYGAERLSREPDH